MVVRTRRKTKRVPKEQISFEPEKRMLKCFDCDCILPEDSFTKTQEGIQCPCCNSLNVHDVNII